MAISALQRSFFDDQQWVLRYFVLETSNTGTARDLISPFSIGKINSREKRDSHSTHLQKNQKQS
jgi:hypothetical protein